MSIPRKIHYCWYGRGKKSDIFEKCLESWKKYMPDCEIIEWNEDNTNLEYCEFLSDAYKNKKWAFVSDVVRFLCVYEQGGIYLDTDVELKATWDEYMKFDSFFFFQNYSQINSGLGFGGKAGDPIIKLLLEGYKKLKFDPSNLNGLASPIENTLVLENQLPDFIASDVYQLIGNTAFFTSEKYWQTAYHYGDFSWKTESQKEALKYAKKKRGGWKIKKIIRSPKIFAFFKKLHLNRFSQLYAFLVYDFIEYGALYWLVRLKQKLFPKKG